MKRILITGAGSYIGESFRNYLKNWPNEYEVEVVDMIDGSWREKSFAGFDAIFHVAGIAHVKERKENRELYYRVNRDLAYETAIKAKQDGVGQFIYLSSMSVYGADVGIITKETIPNPKNSYGKSKLQAEELLARLRDERFRIAFVRPPMVYGKNCKGNFQSLVKLVAKSPVFPKLNNRRSMIYIDNLCEFIRLCADKNLNGLYLPQNREYMRTTDMAEAIAKKLGKKIRTSVALGLLVRVATLFSSTARKGFGSLVYCDAEEFDFCYCATDNENGVDASV